MISLLLMIPPQFSYFFLTTASGARHLSGAQLNRASAASDADSARNEAAKLSGRKKSAVRGQRACMQAPPMGYFFASGISFQPLPPGAAEALASAKLSQRQCCAAQTAAAGPYGSATISARPIPSSTSSRPQRLCSQFSWGVVSSHTAPVQSAEATRMTQSRGWRVHGYRGWTKAPIRPCVYVTLCSVCGASSASVIAMPRERTPIGYQDKGHCVRTVCKLSLG